MPALGTRLRPLTDRLPKPMIPVWNKPLISRAFDHLIASGFTDFMVNTHQLPEVYEAAFAPLSNPERCAATERRG
ncbi:MAG: sugar phosphate nucleotidyltransferase [Verrucomicrobiales bacterium]